MTGRIGFGTTFERETATPGSYTNLGEIIDVTPPGYTRDTVDVTTHSSSNRVREYIGGMRDQTEAEVVILYDPGNTAFDDLKADLLSDTAKNYKITFPDSETVTFGAFCTELTPSTPMADKMTLRAKFKLASGATWS